jgi:hypothetical protein
MPTTLSYGYVRPVTGDGGSAVFTNLENNITQLNDHNHNGTNSTQLSATAIVASVQTIALASWVASGATGHYRQSITLPAGFDYDTVALSFRTTGGAVIYPTVERISDTQCYVYTTDNTIDFIMVVGG